MKKIQRKKGVEDGKYITKAKVKNAAKEMDIAATIGYENLSPEGKELWYEQLAVKIATIVFLVL